MTEVDPRKIKKLSIADHALLFCDGLKFECGLESNYWRWSFSDYGYQDRLFDMITLSLIEDDFINTKKD